METEGEILGLADIDGETLGLSETDGEIDGDRLAEGEILTLGDIETEGDTL